MCLKFITESSSVSLGFKLVRVTAWLSSPTIIYSKNHPKGKRVLDAKDLQNGRHKRCSQGSERRRMSTHTESSNCTALHFFPVFYVTKLKKNRWHGSSEPPYHSRILSQLSLEKLILCVQHVVWEEKSMRNCFKMHSCWNEVTKSYLIFGFSSPL